LGGALLDSEIIFLYEKSPEGGFEARAVGHDIFTQADSLDELKSEIADAIRCNFDDKSKRFVIRPARVRKGN